MTDHLIQSIRLGDWEVVGFVESDFALDGGSMFGVVPRSMWQKLLPPDDQNRIPMRTNLFLVKTGRDNVLIDTGLGDALSDFDRKVYAPRGPSRMDSSLAAVGVTPESVTHVVFSHLHTDHSNGALAGDPDQPRLRFPNARYHVQAAEWDDAMHPNERTSAVYLRHRLQPLADSGRLHLLNGDSEILPGIAGIRTGGHTQGHQAVSVTSAGERFLYYADIIPTRFHLKGPYVAAVDLFPLETMAVKRALLADCCGTSTVIGFDHDMNFIFGRIVPREKWLDVVPVDSVSVAVS
ncbi:MAG: MBL fold metallo-hydrolase [Candidatus Zixiibacteriota bacterium]